MKIFEKPISHLPSNIQKEPQKQSEVSFTSAMAEALSNISSKIGKILPEVPRVNLDREGNLTIALPGNKNYSVSVEQSPDSINLLNLTIISSDNQYKRTWTFRKDKVINVFVSGGIDNNKINIGTGISLKTVDTGNNSICVTNKGEIYSLKTGAGSDSVENFGLIKVLNMGDGNDKLRNLANTDSNLGGAIGEVYTGAGTDEIYNESQITYAYVSKTDRIENRGTIEKIIWEGFASVKVTGALKNFVENHSDRYSLIDGKLRVVEFMTFIEKGQLMNCFLMQGLTPEEIAINQAEIELLYKDAPPREQPPYYSAFLPLNTALESFVVSHGDKYYYFDSQLFLVGKMTLEERDTLKSYFNDPDHLKAIETLYLISNNLLFSDQVKTVQSASEAAADQKQEPIRQIQTLG